MTVRKISVDDGTHRPRASMEGSPFEEVFFDSFQGAVIEYRGPRFPAMETRPVVGSWKGDPDHEVGHLIRAQMPPTYNRRGKI